MKAKKILALVLTLAMVVSLMPMAFAADAEKDPYSIADAKVTELNVTLDGEALKVTEYVDLYYPEQTKADQIVTLYVSEKATEDSPVIYMVNNGGWFMNMANMAYKVTDGTAYVSDSDTDVVGRALADGYVIMSAGSRCRNDAEIGHSPATMADYKAAIRWLRYNDAAVTANTDIIVATGTSGGGALSTVLAASGNSEDYFEDMYAQGAAGLTRNADGTYTSTISDAVWGVIGYCPITDLEHACEAYEWQYNATRAAMYESGHMDYGTVTEEINMAASAELVEDFVEYFDSLGLTVTSETLEEYIISLMKAEIEESIKEIGTEQMKADLAATEYAGTWLTINDDGTYTYDYDEHLYWLARKQTLKPANAFSNVGMSIWKGNMNEDNLFGEASDVYCPFNDYSWMNDDTENDVGYDDTGLTYAEFLATEKGQMVEKQMRMTNTVEYLLDTDADVDTAEYWYVRHGMADRDTAFAVEALLSLAIKNNPSIDQDAVNFEFAWLQGHGGNYDVQEAYDWLESVLPEVANTDIADATVTTITPSVDGEKVSVKWYADGYLAAPNSDKQMVNVYVPENATEDSPIMFYVNNSGWMQNNYPTNTIEDGKDYDGTNDRVGVAMKEGYVVVSYGCRSRTDATIGHSPATMTDTKAVIRYLRANADAITGDMEKIVITGTSGGGALSVIVAASGNSEDYFESLYEVGAAGITKNADGTYTSTIRDDIWATIAYCPITDLGNACAAYDWTWGAARTQLMAEGKLSYKGATAEQVNKNADALTAIYEEYLDSLKLESVSAANLEATIIELMKAEIDESISEFGIDAMKEDLGDADWLIFNEDGTYTYDYDKHTLWVAQQTALKISPAFSNVGTGYGEFMNEDNLFGAPEDVYSPFNEYSWSIDATENAVGQDDTGLTWDEYMATEDGERLALQIKMTNPIPYLLDAEDGDSAPYWYVRYGMADRDSSFAVEAVLNAAMQADQSIKAQSFEFTWLEGHGGNYDVPEAYAWLKMAIEAEDAVATNQKATVDGEAIAPEVYNVAGNNYFKLRDIAAALVGTDAEFAIEIDDAKKIVKIDTTGKYTAVGGELEPGADKSATAVTSEWIIYVDGKIASVAGYNIGGNNFFKLRDLGTALGFGVDYDYDARTMLITTK